MYLEELMEKVGGNNLFASKCMRNKNNGVINVTYLGSLKVVGFIFTPITCHNKSYFNL